MVVTADRHSQTQQDKEQALVLWFEDDVDVAVRSSATAEDLPDASFVGQQETYLNVHDLQCVLEACHKCFASFQSQKTANVLQTYKLDAAGDNILTTGRSVGEKIGAGVARVILEVIDIDKFPPKEENPMLGWRGASHYYDPKYRKAFALECQAFKIENQLRDSP